MLQGAIDGNKEYLELVSKVGIAHKDLQNTNLEAFFNKVKIAVDKGSLSYREAERILGKDLVIALDNVRNNQNAIADDAVDAAARWQENWDSSFNWWNSVKLEAKEFKFNLGSAISELVFGDAVLSNTSQRPYTPSTNPDADPFSIAGRVRDEQTRQSFLADTSDPNNIYKTLTENAWEQAYQPILNPTTSQTSLSSSTEAQSAFVQAQQGILDLVNEGINRGKRTDTTPTTGGGSSPIDRSPEISARAFARANEQGLERALRTAIGGEDFSLAREQAADLHAFRTTAAKQLDTEGEQFLAQQQADFALQDTLLDISSKEHQILADIRNADMEAAKELLNARMELEKINKREKAQANADIAGAIAYLINDSQFAKQYSADLEALKLETASLKAAAALLPGNERASQLAHIADYEQSRIAQINQKFLSFPGGLVTPEPIGVSARGGSSQPQGGTININVSVAGHVRTEGDLADTLFDILRNRQEAGYQ